MEKNIYDKNNNLIGLKYKIKTIRKWFSPVISARCLKIINISASKGTSRWLPSIHCCWKYFLGSILVLGIKNFTDNPTL